MHLFVYSLSNSYSFIFKPFIFFKFTRFFFFFFNFTHCVSALSTGDKMVSESFPSLLVTCKCVQESSCDGCVAKENKGGKGIEGKGGDLCILR